MLREAGTPLEYSEISQRILSNGYYETDKATPHATVNSVIFKSMKDDGNSSPFVRVARGIFGLRESEAQPMNPESTAQASTGADHLTEAEVEGSERIIRAFGMYWRRELVSWRTDPRMLGKQQEKAPSVDFGK